MPIAIQERETISTSNGYATSDMDQSLSPPPPSSPPIIPSETTVDVLIVGAGPIGLLCAYQLVKFSKGKTRVIVIDKEDKRHAPVYGRACTLLPRTLELWDQLGVLNEVINQGVVTKTGFNFEGGKIVSGGLSFLHRMDKHGDTVFNFALHLRQRLIERIFEANLEDVAGMGVYGGYELEGFVDESQGAEAEAASTSTDDMGDYPVRASVRSGLSGEVSTIRAKYIIGADGGKSTVRKTAGIAFQGNNSGAKWIRMDAVVKTNMPSPRSLNSVQSAEHGLLLWCPIDGGRTRIGYVFSEKLQQKWGTVDGEGVSEEAIMEEARLAMKPFDLEFEKVDWFTIYGIGQRMAEQFIKGRVILAGDACHTHSSGSAQGLNTGSHDAINLGWKLSLVLRGLANPGLLQTYATERQALVQNVIDNDTVIATLIGGKYPKGYESRSATHPTKELLKEWFESAANQSFTLGLGIKYAPDSLVNAVNSARIPPSTIAPGERGPDAKLQRIGTGEERRLLGVLRNDGRFSMVVFTGKTYLTGPSLAALSKALGASILTSSARIRSVLTMTTIILGETTGAAEVMGCDPFGTAYLDTSRQAHDAFGIDDARGAVLLFRPDGYLAMAMDMSTAAGDLSEYFTKLLRV